MSFIDTSRFYLTSNPNTYKLKSVMTDFPSLRKETNMDPNKAEELKNILTNYAKPDPKIVQQLPKGGTKLDFVGHADITRILIEVDPYWSWEPCGWKDGRPAIHVENGNATMWGWLTVHGKEMLGVGSAKCDKIDYEKELIGDFLRNASMRFGIALNLWTKNQWADLDQHPAPAAPTKAAAPAKTTPKTNVSQFDKPNSEALTDDQVAAMNKAAVDAGISPISIYSKAGVRFGHATQNDLAALRVAFADLKAEKAAKTEEDK